jgi:hypothetical protein
MEINKSKTCFIQLLSPVPLKQTFLRGITGPIATAQITKDQNDFIKLQMIENIS